MDRLWGLRTEQPPGEHFECQKCGYEVNADYNAAKNIGMQVRSKVITPVPPVGETTHK